jgi:AraC family transcriptional regulator
MQDNGTIGSRSHRRAVGMNGRTGAAPRRASSSRATIERMPPGLFLGRPLVHRMIDGMRLSEMVATVPDRDVARHVHEEVHYVLVLAGAYASSAAGAPALIERPTLIFNPPGTMHRDRFRSSCGRFLTLSFPLERGGAEFARCSPPRACILGRRAENLALAIAREVRCADDCARLTVAGLCEELLATTASQGFEVSRHAPGWLPRLVEFVRAHCAERLVLADVAHCFGTTPAQMAYAVRRHLGATIGVLQRDARDAMAIELIRSGGMSLVDVATRCGYCDQSHMTRALKYRTGSTPAALRAA